MRREAELERAHAEIVDPVVARLDTHTDRVATGLLEQPHLFFCHQVGPRIAEERHTDLARVFLGELGQPLGRQDKGVVHKHNKLERIVLVHPADLFDHMVHAPLAKAPSLALIDL